MSVLHLSVLTLAGGALWNGLLVGAVLVTVTYAGVLRRLRQRRGDQVGWLGEAQLPVGVTPKISVRRPMS